MRISNNILAVAVAASMAVALPACKKSPNSEAVVSVQTGALSIDWNKENVNALLTFVPEDSPFVIASTREVGVDHPVIQRMRAQSEKFLGAVEAFLERAAAPVYTDEEFARRLDEAAPDRRMEILTTQFFFSADEQSKIEIEKNIEFVRMVKDLTKDYKANAPAFGLYSDHIDQILYLDGSILVGKVTVDDGAKLKSKMDIVFQNIPLKTRLKYHEAKAGDETWSIFSMVTENQLRLEMLKRLRTDFMKASDPEAMKKNDKEGEPGDMAASIVAFKDMAVQKIDSEIKELEGIVGGKERFPYNLRLAVHFGKNVVTAVFVTDESQLADYNRVLKPAPRPMDKAALGSIQPNALAVGFFDNVKGFDRLMKNDAARQLFKRMLNVQEEDMGACEGDFKAIVAGYPKVSFAVRADGENGISMDSVLVFNDKDSVKKIQDLHIQSLDIITDKTQLGLKLNMDFGKLFNQAIALVTDISKKQYQCPVLSKVARASKDIPKLTVLPEFASAKRFIDSISGINFTLDKFKIDAKEKFVGFEGVINATGPNFAEIAPKFVEIIHEFNHSMARRISENDALVVGADPVEVHLGEWKFNAMLTQTDFIAATPQYDVKSLLSKERTDNNAFFEFRMASNVYSEIVNHVLRTEMRYNESPELANVMKLLEHLQKINENTVYVTSIGTNDEGIVATGSVIF